MNQQIATTYSQSNKLIKCGIDINTADMFYTDAGGLKLMWENVIPKSEIKTPAWSIFALLNLIPHNELEGVEINNYSLPEKIIWTVVYQSILYPSTVYIKENLIDALVELICSLKINKQI